MCMAWHRGRSLSCSCPGSTFSLQGSQIQSASPALKSLKPFAPVTGAGLSLESRPCRRGTRVTLRMGCARHLCLASVMVSSPQRRLASSPVWGTQHHAALSPAEGLERGNPAHQLCQRSALQQREQLQCLTWHYAPSGSQREQKPAARYRRRCLLTQDTTRPLKQGSLALSSEISSFTTLQRGEEAVRAGSRASEEKEAFPGGCLYPTPGSPGPGLGMRQGEEQQPPPAARLRLPTPTAGQLEGRRQGQNRLSCVHPAALSPHSHFN